MLIQEQERQERRETIINYITENDGCTKAQVIDYMKGRSAVVTTHKIIMKLIQEGTVLVEPDKKNRQTHHLHLNNEFKKISNQLTEIERIIGLMNEPIRKAMKHQPPVARNDQELLKWLEDRNEKPTNFDDLYDHFFYPYEDAVFLMLRMLFVRISNAAISEIDANALRTKILKLMNRISTQIYDVNKQKEYLDFTILELKSFRLSTTKTFAKNHRIDIGLRPNIIQIINDFKKNFLMT